MTKKKKTLHLYSKLSPRAQQRPVIRACLPLLLEPVHCPDFIAMGKRLCLSAEQ